MFRTELPLVPAPQQLPLSARLLTIGSCFSDTIGVRLTEAKVHALVNPFGTVFNPISACKLLRAAAGEDTDWQQHLVEARGRWQSYDLHATLGADSPVDLLQTLQQTLRDTGVFLATADTVILTLGSAWAYRLKETDELVSNCHKMPAEKFDKELLTPDEIINAVAETHAYLRLRNPKLRFVLTVSPVRHLKDTLPLNAVSKSVLRVACHYLSELLPDVSYFPAYELLLDDLRDYRFYAADMLHPSPVAEDYIWERFSRTYFDADFGRFRKEWDSVRLALNHRPLYEAAPEHRQFLVGTLERLEKLASRADMRMEILEVRKRLENLPQPKPVTVIELEDDEERIDVGEESATPVTAAPLQPVALEVDTTTELTADEVVSSEAETLAEAMTETAQPKKKRRNRGGAKRNKKKHATRLAEEALTGENSDAVLTADIDAVADVPVESIAAQDAESTSVAVAFDPEAPLQTALERRKRASRRNRGGNKQTNEAVSEGSATVDSNSLVETIEPTAPTVTGEEEPTLSLAPDPEVSNTYEQSVAPENVAPGSSAGGTQRPLRTGRSASEVRAAALRKPRRPDSRMKALYATPTPAEPEATPSDTVSNDSPAAENLPAVSANVSVPAEIPAEKPMNSVTSPEAPRPPVISAIPPVRGTGASGRLSAAGQATRNAGKAQPATPVSPQVEPSVLPAEAQNIEETRQEVETAFSASDNVALGTAPVVADEPVPVVLPIATAPRKPRAKPINKKAKPAANTEDKPTPVKAKAKKPTAELSESEAAAAVTPAPEATAPTAPPARSRKAAAKPSAAVAPTEKPKRASRRKPKASDEATDASQ